MNHDIVLLVETWTNELCDLDLTGYEYFALHRPKTKKAKRSSGGIVVYYKQSLAKHVSIHKQSDDNIIWLKIDTGCDKVTFICVCYVTPSNSQVITMDVFSKLEADIAQLDEKYGDKYTCLIAGDFNARTNNCDDYLVIDDDRYVPVPDDYAVDYPLDCRVSKDTKPVNANGHDLLQFCKTTSYRILNGRTGNDKGIGGYTCCTTNGSSVVDYMLSRCCDMALMEGFTINEQSPYSDHAMLMVNVTVKSKGQVNHEVHKFCKLAWNKDRSEDYVQKLESSDIVDKFETILCQEANSQESVENMVTDFTNVLQECAKPFFGKTMKICADDTPPKFATWMTEECKELRREFRIHLKRYQSDPSDLNRENMVSARNKFNSCARRCKKAADNGYKEKLLHAKATDAKRFWQMLRHNNTYKPSTSVLPGINDFCEYFKTISNPDDVIYTADEDIYDFLTRYKGEEEKYISSLYDELNNTIDCEEVEKAIKDLKTGKAAGHDLLINELYIYAVEQLTPKLCCLFNAIFKSGCFPKSWTDGIIMPLHKKGDKNKADNYRGITLLSTLGKLFTRVLNNRLTFWSETYSILCDSQAGFRQGYSTVDNIFVLHSVINILISQGKKLYCAFVDFRKAFDYVSRDNLWYKMITAGIAGKMFNIISSMYKEVRSCVKVGGKVSEH